jgi:PBP1b-binding outer membrane lipoprotein LpoB
MKITLSSFLFVSLLALGCSKKDAETEKTEPVETAPTDGTAAKPVEATPTDAVTPEAAAEAEAVVPTVADFEGEAVEQISAETLEKDLSAIEKELGE